MLTSQAPVNRPNLFQVILTSSSDDKRAKGRIREAVRGVERDMVERVGAKALDRPNGLVTPQFRAKRVRPEVDEIFFQAVHDMVVNPEAARCVADAILFPGAHAILGELAKVSAGSRMKSTTIPHGEIVLNVIDHRNGDRSVTITKPAGTTFVQLFDELNSMPNRRQDGVWPKSRLTEGPGNDLPSDRDRTYNFTIHFNSGKRTRSEQKAYLEQRNETLAEPFMVALAEATSLVADGESLFRSQDGADCLVRTGETWTCLHAGVDALSSHDRGVRAHDDYFIDGLHHDPNIVAAGSPNA